MKSFKTFVLALMASLAGTLTVTAQSRMLTGTILDSENLPIPGAAVLIQGTSNGTTADVNGVFELAIPAKGTVLEVSCLGYVSETVKAGPSVNNLKIILLEDAVALEETVVVGYGTQKKVNLTGAIATVSPKSLENRGSHSVTNMLQGAVPGLNITTTSGTPGSKPNINIRGITSINNSDADPLILIDGAVGDLNRVNSNDVESISIIKDASAAAVYGARAAFGVILVTTKSGKAKDGKATVRFGGRWGWEAPTTSTDYETRGYWSVYTHNKFWQAESGSNYVNYTDKDMMELLARVNDVTENPERPWVIEEVRDGRKQWVYYGNYDWYHHLYSDEHPVQQYNLSVSGAGKGFKYYLSGAYDRQVGIIKQNPDVFNKYNLRAKFDFDINKWIKMSNNTSFYSSNYDYIGVDNTQNALVYSAVHALPIFPFENPDGSNIYSNPYTGYKIANGRHILLGDGHNKNIHRKTDFANTTELIIKPIKEFWLTANFTYRFHQDRNTHRKTSFDYREYPDGPLMEYNTGAGEDGLKEVFKTWDYYSTNVFATYDQTFNQAHHLSVVVGFNYESQYRKDVSAYGQHLISKDLNDLNLVVPGPDGAILTEVGGGQSEYALMGVFGRINYDYKGRYLLELSGRYDGTSRFAKGHRWGFFPSVSAGWRISEEPFFAPAKNVMNNFKLRFSFGSLGNQNVANYAYLREVEIKDFKGFTFGDGTTMAKYATLTAPNASDLTWETTQQYNLGLDMAFFNNRLNFTLEGYIRDTRDMLTEGIALPGVYGAPSPKMNSADLRTKGYELSLSWRDSFKLAGSPFGYHVSATLSDFCSHITKFDNPEKSFAKKYYEGMRIGDIWGYEVSGLFETDQQAQEYASNVDLGMISSHLGTGWQAGDPIYVDRDGNKKIDKGDDTANNPGDRKILGNELPSLQYGFNLGFDWYGIDFSIFFQGTGNHYWYPGHENGPFWGPYANPYMSFLPRDFMDNVWAPDNKDAYFPRPLAYAARKNSPLGVVNSRYLQNKRYLRLKNLTVGYTLPQKWTKKIGVEQFRVYFSGENLCYWSPLKKNSKYIDPEEAFNSTVKDTYDRFHYPWQKTMLFGIDITF